MKGKEKPKPNSTRVCLSAIVDIFICRSSKAETQWEIRTSQPKLTVRSRTVKRSAPPPPPCYNTQMDCHIRFRCIGYYTLGLLFPTQLVYMAGLSLRTLSLLVLFPWISHFLIVLIEHKKSQFKDVGKYLDKWWQRY